MVANNTKPNMKKTLKTISTTSILLFGILWILSKFDFISEYNNSTIRSILVVIYLFTNLKYSRMEIDDKNKEIRVLKQKLKSLSN